MRRVGVSFYFPQNVREGGFYRVETVEILHRTVTGVFMSNSNRETEWNNKLEQVKNFAVNNKCWPSSASKEPTEKNLGSWWSRQKYLFNKKDDSKYSFNLSPERKDSINLLIKSHINFERDGIWEDQYKTIVDKIKVDKKLWPYSSTNTEERSSICWWNQQKSFARKFKIDPSKSCGGMTQERWDKIEALARVVGDSVECSLQTRSSVATVLVNENKVAVDTANVTIQSQ